MKILVLLLAVVLPRIGQASDWQFGGAATENKGQTLVFFDADGIQRPSRNTARVWVKSIYLVTLDQYYKKHNRDIVEKSARKVVTGYIPTYFTLEPIRRKYDSVKAANEEAIGYVAYEIIANASEIRISSKFFFEIDCSGKRMKLLDGVMYRENGDLVQGSKPPKEEYRFIPPDTDGEWLLLMVCPVR